MKPYNSTAPDTLESTHSLISRSLKSSAADFTSQKNTTSYPDTSITDTESVSEDQSSSSSANNTSTYPYTANSTTYLPLYGPKLSGSSSLSTVLSTVESNSIDSEKTSTKNSTKDSSKESTIKPKQSSSTDNKPSSSSEITSSKISETSYYPQSTSDSDIITTTDEISQPLYPSPIQTEIPEQTVFYSQIYQITDSATTFTTELQASTIIAASETFNPSSQEIVTKDLNFLAAYAKAHDQSTSTTTSSSSSSKSNSATIAGSVVGSVVGVFLIILALFFYFRKRRNSKRQNIEKSSFSHAISSTRRYDSSNWDFEEDYENFNEKNNTPNNNNNNNNSPFSFIQNFKPNNNNNNQNPNDDTNRSKNLFNQTLGPIMNSSKSSRNKNRTIDTVFEDSEIEPSSQYLNQPSSSSASAHPHPQLISQSPPQPPPQRRYQNSGLKINPFDTATQRYANFSKPTTGPPVPPPTRKNGVSRSEDFHRHGNNRASMTSLESSIISEDTNDDISTDDSLIQFGQDANFESSNRGGFFREQV